MRAERVELEAGFLLHHRPYRETSRLLELFTREHGRVGLVARGVRNSALRGVLQPFQELRVSWTRRGELGTLTQAELHGDYRILPGRVLLSAWYLNELLIRLLARLDPHPELYLHYATTLQKLANAGSGTEAAVLRLFEKHLLENLGYGLQLQADPETGEPVRSGEWYRFDAERGPVRVPEARAGTGLVAGEALLALAHEDLADAANERAARRILRDALETQLGGRDLKTRQVLREVMRKRPDK